MGLFLAGTGRYLPDYILSNQDFSSFLDTSNEWIVTRTGMQKRHISLGEPNWFMAAMAGKAALDSAGASPSDVDVIIGTTVTGDYLFPSMACLAQEYLGARNAFAFDVSAACAGSVFALDMARRYLSSGAGTVLLLCAETLSQCMDYSDRSTCVLFGDGAGAFLLRPSDKLYGCFLHSDSSGVKHIYSKRPRRELPFAQQAPFPHELFPDDANGFTFMDGREVYKWATKAMPLAVRRACLDAGVDVQDLDLIIPHQANLRIIETAAKNLGVPMERIYVNIHEYSNTSSATVAICADECARSGRIRRGDKICFVGFGAGLAYGAVVLEY